MAAALQSEMTSALMEDRTTSTLIHKLAEKENVAPEELAADFADMFTKYGDFLVQKEAGEISENQEYSASRSSASAFGEKYGIENDTLNNIIDKLTGTVKKSSDIPREGDSKLSKGKKFKIFLIASGAILVIMNIIKKNKKK